MGHVGRLAAVVMGIVIPFLKGSVFEAGRETQACVALPKSGRNWTKLRVRWRLVLNLLPLPTVNLPLRSKPE